MVDTAKTSVTISSPNSRKTLPQIVNSWERCLTRYNLDPSLKSRPRILTHSELKEYREPLEEFLFIAKSGMTDLYEKVRDAGYVILLGDANGVTIDYVGEPKDEEANREAGLYLGSVWAEAIEGTCGVGTCIEERRPIIIHRDEHFRARHISLSCATTPLFLPDGSLLGTLDISLLHPPHEKESQLLALQMISYSARLIENAYFLRLYKDSWIIRFNSMQAFVEVVTENLVAVDSLGRIVAANQHALVEMSRLGPFNPLGLHITEVFDLAFEDLMNHAVHKTTTILPVTCIRTGGRYYANFRAPEKNLKLLNVKKEEEKRKPKHSRDSVLTLDYLAGSDPRMLHNVSCAKRIVDKDISILIIGETGTGKEVFAQAIHHASGRESKPFVALNCASIPESLIESELFGYKHGAFTGAHSKGMRGKILQADGGTLFLDEIGDMPLNLQTRLLRVLAEKEILPLGGEVPVKVDLHVVCATLRNLEELVRNGRFREDLYYRLNGVTITLPPLRERRDKALLIENVLAAENANGVPVTIDRQAFDLMLNYHWPGNVRQLRNVLRYALAVNETGTVGLGDLPADLLHGASAPAAPHPSAVSSHRPVHGPADEDDEDIFLQDVLRRHKWNITDSSKELGMSRSTLYRKMKRYNIVPPNELSAGF
jgi:transcriptional regulator of acetoin/glycerol metabolism